MFVFVLSYPTRRTPFWDGLNCWGRLPPLPLEDCGPLRELLPELEESEGLLPPDGWSSSSSGDGVVGGGSQPGTLDANSHLRLFVFRARPAGHLCLICVVIWYVNLR